MSKKVIFPLLAVFTMGIAAASLGCQASASASAGTTEPKAANPPPADPAPPPPPAPPPADPAPPPAPKPIKALGKAKIDGNNIIIPGKIHFATNSTKVVEDKESIEIMKTVYEVMKGNPQITKLRIEGHTDNVGKSDANMTLSQGRADSVITWLVNNQSMDKGRLDGKGWGDTRPLVKNDSAANKEQNRRVEFKIWEIDGKPTDAQTNDGAATPAAATAATGKDPKAAATPAATPAAASTGKK
jgi:outer membrane protein OmpA-like peptidoglycan-associated protein